MTRLIAALILTDRRALALSDALRATLATALALCHDAGPEGLPLTDLACARRRSEATVRRHLAALAREGWALTRGVGRAMAVVTADIALAPPAWAPLPDRALLPDRAAADLGRDETAPAAPPAGVKTGSVPEAAHKKKIEALEEEAATSSSPASLSSSMAEDSNELASEVSPAAFDEALAALEALGVYTEVAVELARLPWVTPALARRCAVALRARPGVRSVAGLLVSVLRDRESAIATANAAPRLHCQAAGRATEAARIASEAPPAADPALKPLQDAWRRALVRLETTWDPQAVALHLKAVRPLGAENGVLLLGVPSAISADWLSARARGDVLTALDAGVGRPLRDVRFVVARQDDLARPATG